MAAKDEKKQIAPVLQEDTDKANEGLLMPPVPEVEHNPSEYLLSGPDGDFNVGERTYNRTFKNNPDFTVKKSPTK